MIKFVIRFFLAISTLFLSEVIIYTIKKDNKFIKGNVKKFVFGFACLIGGAMLWQMTPAGKENLEKGRTEREQAEQERIGEREAARIEEEKAESEKWAGIEFLKKDIRENPTIAEKILLKMSTQDYLQRMKNDIFTELNSSLEALNSKTLSLTLSNNENLGVLAACMLTRDKFLKKLNVEYTYFKSEYNINTFVYPDFSEIQLSADKSICVIQSVRPDVRLPTK